LIRPGCGRRLAALSRCQPKSPAEQEAKLKADERKARTRQLIHAGGLIDKVGLLALDPNILYGALLSLRDGAADPEQVRQWTALGGRTFAREARLAEEGKEAIGLAFSAALGRDATTALRGSGFRFNKLLQHWEGLAHFDEAETLATAHGGTVRREMPVPHPIMASRKRAAMRALSPGLPAPSKPASLSKTPAVILGHHHPRRPDGDLTRRRFRRLATQAFSEAKAEV
jgi:hypothetical protein